MILLIFLGDKVTSVEGWARALVVAGLAVTGMGALFFAFMTLAFGLFVLTLMAEAGIAGVKVLDGRTADGTIGIVGAGLLVAGFAFQLVAVV